MKRWSDLGVGLGLTLAAGLVSAAAGGDAPPPAAAEPAAPGETQPAEGTDPPAATTEAGDGSGGSSEGAAAAAPAAPAWAEVRATVRPDPPPEETTRGKHYVVSDEKRHDLFRSAIEDLGGISSASAPTRTT